MASLPIPNSHKAEGRPIKNVSLEQELQPQSKHIIPYYYYFPKKNVRNITVIFVY